MTFVPGERAEDGVRDSVVPGIVGHPARMRQTDTRTSSAGSQPFRGAAWFGSVGYDLRLALRALVRDRRFVLAGVLILALSIALNVAAFRVLNTMLFRGYPLVRDSDRVLEIDEQSPNAGCCVAFFDFEHWRREAPGEWRTSSSGPVRRGRRESGSGVTAGLTSGRPAPVAVI